MNILKQADEITLQRIAEEFPIDFGKEDIFERAYHAYLEKSAEPKSPIRRHAVHIAAAAACCVLVLGAAYAIGIAPRQIPSIPEESTTETHAAAKPTQENTETTVHTEHTEQTENTVQTENTKHTNPTETTAAQTTAAVSETGTQTQTGVAVVIPSTAETTAALPATTPQPVATDPTEPIVETQTDITMEPIEPTEKPVSTTQPEIAATDPTWMTEAATDIPAISTENPVIPTEEEQEEHKETARPPHTESPEEPTEPTESPEEPTEPTEATTLPTLPGYDVTLENGQLQVVYQQEVPASPMQLRPYKMADDRFTIVSTSAYDSKRDRRKYRILHQETGETFTVYQSRREQFRAACQSDAELLACDINGDPAFLAIYTAYKAKYCALYWDDGDYTFTVTSTDENREVLLQLAESFRSPVK
ncbi:MAG: hypothetical protein IKK51_07980 [Oscillospiraceae bacterium]|nr:hypothetical protein [Oscillospiraceae bacterium]